MTETNEPRVGEGISAGNANWTFKGDVASGFSEHVRKSVPLYDVGHDLACKVSDYFVQEGSICYELGSSTGTLTTKLAARHKNKGAKFVGIEQVPEMIERAGQETDRSLTNLEFVEGDIVTFPYETCDFIVAYYTIQFVPPYLRQELINRLYEALNWGGALLLFEKVRAPDARFQDYMTGLYTDFKIDQGYSSDEIVNKTRSLKRVMEPFSTQGNLDLMGRAGFKDIMTVMKYVCFEGFLAIK